MSSFFLSFAPLIRNSPQLSASACWLAIPPLTGTRSRPSKKQKKFVDREASIASVMEKEVLSKHRKALMLFGTFHLVHGIDDSAVSAYEKDYPNRTFVLSDLSVYDTNRPAASISPFALWPNPSIALTKGTSLGALLLSDISRRESWSPPIARRDLLYFPRGCKNRPKNRWNTISMLFST